MSLRELSKYIFSSKYARYLPEKKRRETWRESVDRVKSMHLKKYPHISEEINRAFEFYYSKKIYGSQRTLQFGGDPVLKHNVRSFNCAGSYCDRLKFFQEVMYILLCGCGTGYSIQKHHIAKLPKFSHGSKLDKTYIIPDSIEGWADSIGVLLSSYFENPVFEEYANTNVIFDYSQIRPKGTELSASSGKAPGPDPLKKAHEKITYLLNRCIKEGQLKLRPIDANDIIMYMADSVLSGGVRRSSCIALFSPDDEEMLKAKTGNWFYDNPQRARANNSVLLLRNKTTYEDFIRIIENTREFGEPGFIWADNIELTLNPCRPTNSIVATPDGLRTLQEVKIGDNIWSQEGWVKIIDKWSTGINNINEYVTTANKFISTPNHLVINNQTKYPINKIDSLDIATCDYESDIEILPEYIMDGLVLGDGSVHEASNNLVHLHIGQNDEDYFSSEIATLIIKHRPGISATAYQIKTSIQHEELPLTHKRQIPDRFLKGNRCEVASFLRGIYSANGSICGQRVTLKSTSLNIIRQTQLMLSYLGIKSYFTTNKSTTVKFKNGTYNCKQSYDLNISTDRIKFQKYIGFIQKYKQDKLAEIIDTHVSKPKSQYDITHVNKLPPEETFEITVDNKSHTYWSDGINSANCAEAIFYSYFNNQSGWQFCNLCSINGKKIKTKEDFYAACEAAAVIGTLQAGYTEFPYLGNITEEITKREALLGVSITGMMDNPDILLDPEVQKHGAQIVKKTNKRIAKLIGINPAARTTLNKPDGSGSLVVESSSGIHPHHAKRYFRNVQANKTESLARFFKIKNEMAVEKSAWGDDDYVLTFCIEVEKGAKVKNDLNALSMLEYVKSTQLNWVTAGRNIELCTQPWLNHSVSNTINIKDNEWEDAAKFIYDNRDYFCGVSLLPIKGDKDYKQAPNTAVLTSEEIIKEYGEGSLFASGLIVEALEIFDNDLWLACDYIIGKIKSNSIEQDNLINKVQKFAIRYLGGDIKKTTYLMKDVYNAKRWQDLTREYNEVDYTECIEEEDNTKLEQEIACSGGACTLI